MSGFVRVMEMEAEAGEERAEAKAKARRVMLDTSIEGVRQVDGSVPFGVVFERVTVSPALADAILARLAEHGIEFVERGRA